MNALPPRTPSPQKLSPALMLVLSILLAAALRLCLLGHKTFSADEGIAWWMALGEIEHDAPAVYRWVFGGAIRLFGWNEFAGRFPSALFGLLSIPVIYAIGRTCFNSRFGLYAAFFAAISAYLVPLSQEMRIYSLLGLETLLTLWIFLRILREPQVRWGWWIALLTVGLAGQYTHCFFIFVLGYLGLALLLVKQPRKWQDALKYLVIIIVVVLLSLPELLKSFSVAADRPHVYAADFYHLKMNTWRLLRSYFCFLFGDYFTNRPGSIGPFLRSHPIQIGVALLMIGTWISVAFSGLRAALFMARGDGFQAQIARVLLGMLISFSLLFVLVDVSTSGHLIFVYIPFLLLMTAFWANGRTMIRRRVLIIFLLLTGISFASYYRLPYFAYERADWRSAGRMLGSEFRPDDALLILQARNAYYTVKFYDPSITGDIYYYPRHERATLQSRDLWDWWNKKSPQEKVDSLLSTHNRVWVLESNLKWQPEIHPPIQTCQTRDLGYDLQLHLIKTHREPTEADVRD